MIEQDDRVVNTMRKTICFFTGDMSRGGGTEHITQIISNGLNKLKKYNIIVLSLNNKYNSCYYPLDKGVTHYGLETKGVGKISIFKNIYLLRKFVKEKSVDILINVDIMLGIFSLPMKIFSRVKLIGWEQFSFHDNIGSSNTELIRKLSLKFCDYYINLTKADMEMFKKNFKVNCPITYIYNPVSNTNTSSEYNINSKTIMTAGNFFPVKGFDLAVEVAKKVISKYPEWKWEFYGDGEEYQSIKKMIINYKLTNNVFLCGRKQSLSAQYKKSSIYVMTSRMEGFGLTLLEAKSNNLPVVAFDVPFGPKEIIDDNVDGFLVNAFDIEQMADRINKLIENKNLRYKFSNNAKNNMDKFNIDNIIGKWCKILDDF